MTTAAPTEIESSVSSDPGLQSLLPIPPNLSHFLFDEEFGRHMALDVDFSEAASEKIYPQIVRIVRKNAAHFWFTEEFITQLVNPQRIQDAFHLKWTKVLMTQETIQGFVDECAQQVWRKWIEKRLEENRAQISENKKNTELRRGKEYVESDITRLGKAIARCNYQLLWTSWDEKEALLAQKEKLKNSLDQNRTLRYQAERALVLPPEALESLEQDIVSCTAALWDWDILKYPDLASALHRELYDKIFQHVAHYFYDASHIFAEAEKERGIVQTWQAENQRRTEQNATILEQRAINIRVKKLLIARTVWESLLIGTLLFWVSQKILELLFSHK